MALGNNSVGIREEVKTQIPSCKNGFKQIKYRNRETLTSGSAELLIRLRDSNIFPGVS